MSQQSLTSEDQAVHHMHLMAFSQQHGDECRADIAGTACEHDTHAESLWQKNSARECVD